MMSESESDKSILELVAHEVRVLTSLGRHQEALIKINTFLAVLNLRPNCSSVHILLRERLKIFLALELWEDAKTLLICQPPFGRDDLVTLAHAYLSAGWVPHAKRISAEFHETTESPNLALLRGRLSDMSLATPHCGIARLFTSSSERTYSSSISLKHYNSDLGLPTSKVSRVLAFKKRPWPYNHGAILKGARVIGADWGVYSSEYGAMQYTTFHTNIRMEVAWPPRETQRVNATLPSIHIETPTILLGGFYNFYHALIDYYINSFYYHRLVGLIDSGELEINRSGRFRPAILVAEDSQEFHGEMLEFFNIPSDQLVRLKYGEVARCDELVILPRTAMGYGEIRDIRPIQWLQSLVKIKSKSIVASRRVYITRRNAKTRRVLNEESIIKVLDLFRFTVLELETFSFIEQLAHFSTAQVVVGPHGAGMSHIIAATQRITVIEFMPSEGTIQDYFLNLARSLGHKFVRIKTSGRLEDGSDFEVDLRKLIACCEELDDRWRDHYELR